MTPEQWQNVADCARQRWDALVEERLAGTITLEGWARRAGEFESWQMAQARTGRCPF